MDLVRVDSTYLEQEFDDALKELDRVETMMATLFRAVLAIKRTQVCRLLYITTLPLPLPSPVPPEIRRRTGSADGR